MDDASVGDSIYSDYPEGLQLSVYKFVTPTANYNAKDAIDKFDIISPVQAIDYLADCPNAKMTVTATLNASGTSYEFKVGLKSNTVGDYLIKFPFKQRIQNTERNLDIMCFQSPS